MSGRGVAKQLHQPRPRIRSGARVRDRVCGGVSEGEGGRGVGAEAVGVVGVVEVGAAMEGRGGRWVGVWTSGRRRGGGASHAREDARGGRGGGRMVRVWRRSEELAELEGGAKGGVRIPRRRCHLSLRGAVAWICEEQ